MGPGIFYFIYSAFSTCRTCTWPYLTVSYVEYSISLSLSLITGRNSTSERLRTCVWSNRLQWYKSEESRHRPDLVNNNLIASCCIIQTLGNTEFQCKNFTTRTRTILNYILCTTFNGWNTQLVTPVQITLFDFYAQQTIMLIKHTNDELIIFINNII